ncbi:glutathione S-transferase family protein [Jeongeupia naejangsanensis]|uniref:Glutathione S-transferase family protein n=1 Tax=Jeongeupia naejangsanensis TaxID=613195 RepID=A0ABS2BNC0_9NEIS|nr:glutathione S-transferase family protein [Jeongeupia naejangsanensis]MBM3117114.1 glutathione S-transferase family protein [Jeongeupia naejangsanensis]
MKLVIGNKNYSSWSLRPWLAMKIAGLPFDEVNHDLYAAGARDQRLRFGPTGKVPVLIDGDVTIWETPAIAEYLAEAAPSLWPADRAARAVARAVCAEMHAGFTALRTQCPMDVHLRTLASVDAALGADLERVAALWADCRARFGAGGDFLFGRFSHADAFFAPVATRIRSYGLPVSQAAQAYAETLLALPAFLEWEAAAGQEARQV